MPAQEEVAAQPAVEVLDDRTGADDVLGHRVHGFLEIIEAVAESLPQRRLLLPPLERGDLIRMLERIADAQLALAREREQSGAGLVAKAPRRRVDDPQERRARFLLCSLERRLRRRWHDARHGELGRAV